MSGFILGVRHLSSCEPAAYDYLRKHGLSTTYKDWQLVPDSADNEELLITGTTVIWTSGRVLKRAFDFAADGQPILHALFVSFPTPESDLKASTPISQDGARQPRFASSRNAFKSTAHLRHLPASLNKTEVLERALVIILEELAYIYYDDGRRDVIHIPFRVKRAFPGAKGLLMERDVDRALVKEEALPTLFCLPRPLDEIGVITAKDNRWTIADEVIYTGNGLLISSNKETNTTTLWSLDYTEKDASEASLHSNRLSQARRRSSILRPSASMGPDDFHSIRTDSLHFDRVVIGDMDPALLFSEAESLRKDAVLTPIETIAIACDLHLPKAIVLKDQKSLVVMLRTQDQRGLTFVLKRSSSGRFAVVKTDKMAILDMIGMGSYALLRHQDETLYLHSPLGLRIQVDGLRKGVLIGSRGSTVWTKAHDCAQMESFELTLLVEPLVQKLLSALQVILSRQHHEQLYFAMLHAQRSQSQFDAFVSTLSAGFLQPCVLSDVDPAFMPILQLFEGCDLSFSKLYYPQIVLAIHFVCEELALDVLTAHASAKLIPILLQMSSWLAWPAYVFLYQERLTEACSIDERPLAHIAVASPTDPPPSVLAWVEQRARGKRLAVQTIDMLSTSRGPYRQGKEVISTCPLTQSLLHVYDSLFSSSKTLHQGVELMARQLTIDQIDKLPQPLAIPLRDAIRCCGLSPSSDWTAETLRFVGRHDLADFLSQTHSDQPIVRLQTETQTTEEASRSEANGQVSTGETRHRNMLRMIWPGDLRIQELEKMLCYSKPAVVSMPENENLGEADVVRLQESVARNVAKRTLASPVGFGIFEYDSADPMPTEMFAQQELNLDVKFKPVSFTVAEDKEYMTPQFKMWGQFHNGCAAGLSISPKAQGVSASWIVYNKPAELNDKHAGFLLGLGLNGHLKVMATWHAFNYLTSKHTMTSIGLLLGMSASFLGTMDSMITKLLSVHVLALLPHGANELNLSGQTQAAGLMGIGLLHFNTKHRRMTEVMLGEICAQDKSEDHFRDESYRLSAGLSLGFINVGLGPDLKSVSDAQMFKSLLACVYGDKREKHDLDVKIPGAVMALGLLFLQTGNLDIAKKLAAPATEHDLEHVRPDILMLRVLASRLICWSSITPTEAFVASVLPSFMQPIASLRDQKVLETDDLALYYMLTGGCFAMGIRYAGTHNLAARDVLLCYLDRFLRLSHLPATSFDQKACKIAIRSCVGVLCLSCAMVVAGTGDLQVMRRLRVVHYCTEADISFGAYLAVEMALGLLIMGGGRYSLASTKLATASLVVSCYPILPNAVADNGAHLQALRHLWVLAVEPRCIIPRDTLTRAICSLPLRLTMQDQSIREVLAPCLLPPLEQVQSVTLASQAFLPVTLQFAAAEEGCRHLAAFKEDQTLWVSKKTDQEEHLVNPRLEALEDDTSAALNQAIHAVLPNRKETADSLVRLMTMDDAQGDDAAAFMAREVCARTRGPFQLQGLDLVATYMHITTRGRLKDKFVGCQQRLLSEEDASMLGLRLWQARRR
ncbi:hypothetical protein BCR37DRAFT_355995 [Protomyces lactucae-debilis]|uniref:Anaphase-promoting complex subunit 1 N-terminal domain-containing protein n=1 Tax=Protomyces lactucae-debilis TaxID=2754530 RepID=A0A1Y2FNB8_PROLT|nr:uncharacterized protein BCR37DRAFT_355995 [Protomyces lactucae-debilis]ORY85087.1 hypothetical protein BCR37DRAFT_355995 [Protomyces lactucae-debilis]